MLRGLPISANERIEELYVLWGLRIFANERIEELYVLWGLRISANERISANKRIFANKRTFANKRISAVYCYRQQATGQKHHRNRTALHSIYDNIYNTDNPPPNTVDNYPLQYRRNRKENLNPPRG